MQHMVDESASARHLQPGSKDTVLKTQGRGEKENEKYRPNEAKQVRVLEVGRHDSKPTTPP